MLYLALAPEASLLQPGPNALDSPSMLWVTAVVPTCALMFKHLGVIHQTCTQTHKVTTRFLIGNAAVGAFEIFVCDLPVVKRGLLVVSCAAKLSGFSGRVREVDAGDDCVRDSGRWTPSPLLTPLLLRSMGTARVSICRCSCCSCFCCSHSNDCSNRRGLGLGG